MSAIAKKIVLVGGGNAAGYFARAVVAAGRGAELTMIAAENVLPYERPALTKAFLHAESPARLPGFHTSVGGGGERQTAEWYATHGVEVILGTRVVDANLEEKTVVTDAGKSYSYDKLVVAIGCTALKLPSAIGGDLPGVHRVRDVADALALCDAMDGCAKGSVVIGGGYVGLEVAAALATRGLSPRVVMMEPHIMSRLWTREIAEKYEKLYEAKGDDVSSRREGCQNHRGRRRPRRRRRGICTGPHTTAFARWTPILKDFSRRLSPPIPRFQSPSSTPFNSY